MQTTNTVQTMRHCRDGRLDAWPGEELVLGRKDRFGEGGVMLHGGGVSLWPGMLGGHEQRCKGEVMIVCPVSRGWIVGRGQVVCDLAETWGAQRGWIRDFDGVAGLGVSPLATILMNACTSRALGSPVS